LLKDSEVEPILFPPRSPNLNAHCERLVRSIKEEALHSLIIMDEESLRYVLTQYLAHDHQERNHQGLDNQLIAPETEVSRPTAQVVRRERPCHTSAIADMILTQFLSHMHGKLLPQVSLCLGRCLDRIAGPNFSVSLRQLAMHCPLSMSDGYSQLIRAENGRCYRAEPSMFSISYSYRFSVDLMEAR
jgi:hypothetical protein